MKIKKATMESTDMKQCCKCLDYCPSYKVVVVTEDKCVKYDIPVYKNDLYICLDCAYQPLVSKMDVSSEETDIVDKELQQDPGTDVLQQDPGTDVLQQDPGTDVLQTPGQETGLAEVTCKEMENEVVKSVTSGGRCMVPGCNQPPRPRGIVHGLPRIFYESSKELQQLIIQCYNLPDTKSDLCKVCYERIYYKVHRKRKLPDGSKRQSLPDSRKKMKFSHGRKRQSLPVSDVQQCCKCKKVRSSWKTVLVRDDMFDKYQIPFCPDNIYICLDCTYQPFKYLNGTVAVIADQGGRSSTTDPKKTNGRKNIEKKCMASTCGKEGRTVCLPELFLKSPDDLRKIIQAQFGLPEGNYGNVGICLRCKRAIYGATYKKMKSKTFAFLLRDEGLPVATTASERTPHTNVSAQKFGCGWCSFTTCYPNTVVKHHYKNHHMQELKVVRLSHKNKVRKGSVEFNCESCAYSSRYRHQMHLHNDKYHEHCTNRDGITDYESDGDLSNHSDNIQTANSRKRTYRKDFLCDDVRNIDAGYENIEEDAWSSYGRRMKPINVHHIKKFKLKKAKVECVDFLKADMRYVLTCIQGAGVSKLNVDSLPQAEMVQFAVRSSEDVFFKDTNIENYEPVCLFGVSPCEIERLYQ